jgi:hypothetical protein
MRNRVGTRNPIASRRSTRTAAIVGFILLAAAVLGNLHGWTAEQSKQALREPDDEAEAHDANPRPKTGTTAIPARSRNTPAKEGRYSLDEKSIVAALGTSIDVDFLDTPLEEALISLGKQCRINVWLDRQSTSDAGVALDQPVNLRLKGLGLESVLNLLLGPCKLDWVVQDDVLKISTREWADAHPEIRTYYVQNLIDAGHTPDDLVASITTCVAPGSWSGATVKICWQGCAFSGPAGCREYPSPAGISHSGGVLVIRHSRRTQAQISQLLHELDEISRVGK